MSDKTNSDNAQPNNPLHGIRLIDILEYLVDEYGWEDLGYEIKINCFQIKIFYFVPCPLVFS